MTDIIERLEELARQFKKDTGLLAPFKDAPNAVGGDPEYNQAYRQQEWDKWLKARKAKGGNSMTQMTDQELKERLAGINLRHLTLVKIRDDYSPAMIEPELTDLTFDLFKHAGYVQLAEDQRLPEIPEFQYDAKKYRPYLKRGAINYSKMLSGFRRIKQ